MRQPSDSERAEREFLEGLRYEDKFPAMDADSIRTRLDEMPYNLAVRASEHQSAFTVDLLARKLRTELPALIERLAAEVEAERHAP